VSKQKILIITHTHDNGSVNRVIDFIKNEGAEAIRFNTDGYPLSVQLSTVYANNQWTILFNDGHTIHNLQDVTAVWYRRSYNLGNGLKNIVQPEYVAPAIQETKRTLFGMLEGLNCFHLERFSTYRRLDSKEEQLKVAVQNGLLIPDTCISNDPQQVKQFLQQHNGSVITKMQHSFAIYKEQEEHVVFTNELPPDSYDELHSLQYCPMVFQQRIEKKLELRVTIVGEKCFAFAIDSQKNSHAKVDWRKEGHTLLNQWQSYELPAMVQEQLLSFMDSYKINYGAIDLILTPDDKYYFLEINAAGEYFWLDALCEHNISKQIADVLIGKAKRRI
jgi:hypothetical protein